MCSIDDVTGKIHVEIERARLTMKLSKIKEADGDIAGAADVLHELQVETYGSMDRREKVEFILDQMRLSLAKKDYIRTGILAKKISTRFFDKEEYVKKKCVFHEGVLFSGGGFSSFFFSSSSFSSFFVPSSLLNLELDRAKESGPISLSKETVLSWMHTTLVSAFSVVSLLFLSCTPPITHTTRRPLSHTVLKGTPTSSSSSTESLLLWVSTRTNIWTCASTATRSSTLRPSRLTRQSTLTK